MPDILTLLTNNIDLSTRLGEHYKSNPQELNNRLAALHDSLNVQNQYEIAAYKEQMADDPKATDELARLQKIMQKQMILMCLHNKIMIRIIQVIMLILIPIGLDIPNGILIHFGILEVFGLKQDYTLGLAALVYGVFPGYGFSNWFFNGGHYNRYPNLYRQYGNYYRHNVAENRVMGSVNHGFMGNANNHFNPKGGNQSKQAYITFVISARKRAIL